MVPVKVIQSSEFTSLILYFENNYSFFACNTYCNKLLIIFPVLD